MAGNLRNRCGFFEPRPLKNPSLAEECPVKIVSTLTNWPLSLYSFPQAAPQRPDLPGRLRPFVAIACVFGPFAARDSEVSQMESTGPCQTSCVENGERRQRVSARSWNTSQSSPAVGNDRNIFRTASPNLEANLHLIIDRSCPQTPVVSTGCRELIDRGSPSV
jgi:hypothetical protein